MGMGMVEGHKSGIQREEKICNWRINEGRREKEGRGRRKKLMKR
jgi:hypothetical protein